MPINPESFGIVHDKLSTHLILQENNIPMPTTYFAASREAARKLLKKINYPIILKFPKGTQGKGVMFADSYTSANTILDALDSLKQPFIIQEFIETMGTDTRVIVLGEKVAAAMKRKAAKGDVRSNIHSGGMGEEVILDEKTRRLCIKTAKVLKSEICAIDLLDGAHGPVVIEANISPGLQGITKATGKNVAAMIAEFLYMKTHAIKSNEDKGKKENLFEEMGLSQNGKNGSDCLITPLRIKNNSIIVPELILKKTKLYDGEDVEIKFKEGQILFKKFK